MHVPCGSMRRIRWFRAGDVLRRDRRPSQLSQSETPGGRWHLPPSGALLRFTVAVVYLGVAAVLAASLHKDESGVAAAGPRHQGRPAGGKR